MWLGLDVGTFSVKVVLLDARGSVLGRGSGSVQMLQVGPGRAEQRPQDYVHAAAKATQEACSAAGDERRFLKGIGLSGQTPTLVVVDDEGDPVRPALSWQTPEPNDKLLLSSRNWGTRSRWSAPRCHGLPRLARRRCAGWPSTSLRPCAVGGGSSSPRTTSGSS